jgi:hypothetical protein
VEHNENGILQRQLTSVYLCVYQSLKEEQGAALSPDFFYRFIASLFLWFHAVCSHVPVIVWIARAVVFAIISFWTESPQSPFVLSMEIVRWR